MTKFLKTPGFGVVSPQGPGGRHLIATFTPPSSLVSSGSGPPNSDQGVSNQFYWDDSTTPPTLYVNNEGTWTQVSSTLPQIGDGEVLANISGGTATPTGDTVSAILDHVFSNVQGSILFRNATDWIDLPPGSAGDVLTTNGAAADPAWAPAGGGGGGQHEYEAYGALPLAASFSTYNFQTGTTLTDQPTSLMFDLPGQTGFDLQVAYKAAPATPYDIYMRAKFVGWSGASRGGLCLFNSTTKRCLTIQFLNANQIGVLDDTGPNTFNSQGTTFTGNSGISWFRWHNDGTTLTPYISADGINWLQLGTATFSEATYAPDSIAIQAWNAASVSEPTCLWIGSFGTSPPA